MHAPAHVLFFFLISNSISFLLFRYGWCSCLVGLGFWLGFRILQDGFMAVLIPSYSAFSSMERSEMD